MAAVEHMAERRFVPLPLIPENDVPEPMRVVVDGKNYYASYEIIVEVIA